MLPARFSTTRRGLGLLVVATVLLVTGTGASMGSGAAHRPSREVAFHPKREHVESVLMASGVVASERLAGGLPVGTGWVTQEVGKRTITIPRKTERIIDSRMDRGMTRVEREGRDGLKEQTLLVWRGESGIVSESVLSERITLRPQAQLIAVGSREPMRTLLTSRGSYNYRNVLTMVATAYEPSERSCGIYANGITAIGMKARPGVVAVDPKVIPLRTRLYVEGYGPAIAADVGSAIKGNRIDLFYETVQEALAFGRRKVKVYILEER